VGLGLWGKVSELLWSLTCDLIPFHSVGESYGEEKALLLSTQHSFGKIRFYFSFRKFLQSVTSDVKSDLFSPS